MANLNMLPVLLIGLISSVTPGTSALQCQTCTDLQCSNTTLVTCSSETMCVTASILATSSGTTAPQIFKACASSSLCPATGSQTFSANLGVSGAVASVECCNTDDCNGATLLFPAAQTVNALQCLTCNPVTSQCTYTLQCSGVEDRCFQASVISGYSTSAFGCASTNMCAAAASLGSLPFMPSIGSISSGSSCCGTSLCNTLTTAPPTSTTATPTTAPPTSTTATPTTAPPTSTTATPTTAPPTSTTATPTTAPPSSTTATPTTAPPTSTTATPTTAPPTSTTASPTSTTASPTTAPPTTTTATPTSTIVTSTTTQEGTDCQYNGFNYNAGESFWTEGCSQRCECRAPNDLSCSAASCTPTQECTIRNGQLGCFDEMSTCTVTGDPHYITFDRALAHFQGTCSYIITESVNPGINETQFQVVATNNHRGNNRVSFVSAVDVYLSNQLESVHVRIGPNRRVKVNGSEVSLPTTVGTLTQVVRQGSYIVVDAVDLKVHFDGRSTLLVRLGQYHQNRVTGMCGNFNRDPSDDKVLPNGTLAQNDNHFGHSWKSSTSQPGCGSTDESSDDGLDDCPFMEEYSELCSVITNSSGPFSACHLHSDPQPFFSSCVYDLCLYTPANGMLCSAVSAYESTCSVLGLNIPEWRSALLCAESDPCEQLNCTEYEWCGEKHGVYGCFCDEHHHRPNNESYDSSLSCSSSSGTMSVSRCQLFEAGFHSSALHLRDDSCNGTLQDGRLVFQFNNDEQLCGTALKSNGTHFIYENTIQGDVDPHGGLISRQRSIHLRFCCEYLLTQALSMAVGINPVESIVRKKLLSGQGQYRMRMIPYQDAGFHYPLASGSNLEIEIDERLYVEIRTEGVDGRQISTILDSCWATPVNLASYPVRWDLIQEECPNPADGTVELVANGISTAARFSFKMFTFSNFSSIYLHCQVHLCLRRHNNCTAHCYPGHHNRVARDVSQHAMTGISLGPLTMPLNRKARMVKPSSASGQLAPLVTLLVSLLAAKTLV